ncbi:MAG: UDP-glucose--hexose-1-phosphate uridylyltransferase [Coprobacillus sp.]|nr:UDP-glucose--hexose-1-phosphate uridylyltransferase [Coprobacillus sp.]
MIDNDICRLVSYALTTNLIEEQDIDYCINRLLEIFGLTSIEGARATKGLNVKVEELPDVLKALSDYAVEKGIIKVDTVTCRDLFESKLMDVFLDHPTAITNKFYSLCKKDPERATDWFYKLCNDSNYIRRYRTANDIKWSYKSDYGWLDITINLSKPEKDPRDIAAAKNAKEATYPKCQLCKENIGFPGSVTQQPRNNLRAIPLDFNKEKWYFQYSPYVYYNEHCIVFSEEHTPMVINNKTFENLVSFLDYFPHYTIGSNADLPIVGGSILSHEHFQGGRYTFPLQKAKVEAKFELPQFKKVDFALVRWPMSVIRLESRNSDALIEACSYILDKWKHYTDASASIYAFTGEESHNTITPIAYKDGRTYVMDLVLRNNITTKEHPLGLFHPHANLHHIKKENIGLIEVMGLAILPARLKDELDLIADKIIAGEDVSTEESLKKHAEWVEEIKSRHDMTGLGKETIINILHEEVGKVFADVLTDAGVYKCTSEGREAFWRFIEALK